MATASSPNPMNVIVLAGVAIGAFWLFSRRANAAPIIPARPANASGSSTAQTVNAVGNLLGGLGRLFGGGQPAVNVNTAYYRGQLPMQQYGQAQQWSQNDSDPGLNGSVADWVSGGSDGLAFNPPGNTSAWDAWLTNGTVGD